MHDQAVVSPSGLQDGQRKRLDLPLLAIPGAPSPASARIVIALRYTRLQSALSLTAFEQLCVLGQGSYGKVVQVIKKDTGQIYAMKIIKKSQVRAGSQALQRERDILMRVQHPFLLRLQYCFQTETRLYFIMNFLGGGDLYVHLKRNGRFPADRARFYAAEIALAVEYLHDHGIVYRDLKAENVVLDSQGECLATLSDGAALYMLTLSLLRVSRPRLPHRLWSEQRRVGRARSRDSYFLRDSRLRRAGDPAEEAIYPQCRLVVIWDSSVGNAGGIASICGQDDAGSV